MRKMRFILLAVTLLATAFAGAQGYEGTPRRSTCPEIPTNNPVYSDALDLADALTNAHVNVKCVTLNKGTNSFEGQEGVIYLRTDDTMLHAFFMPRPQDFSGLQVFQHRQQGHYNYTFRGTPKMKSSWGGIIDSSFAGYFVRYENALIIAFDKQLALQIEKGLPGARILKVEKAD